MNDGPQIWQRDLTTWNELRGPKRRKPEFGQSRKRTNGIENQTYPVARNRWKKGKMLTLGWSESKRNSARDARREEDAIT